MNQVDRRRREQLLPAELALLKSCGSDIRKTDREALALARGKCVGNTTSRERFFKAVRHLFARRTWGRLIVDLACKTPAQSVVSPKSVRENESGLPRIAAALAKKAIAVGRRSRVSRSDRQDSGPRSARRIDVRRDRLLPHFHFP